MALDRKNIRDAIKALFVADTGTLYGNTKLINNISSDEVQYINAKTGVNNLGYKMFLRALPHEKVQDRSQNQDYSIATEYRINAVTSNPQTGKDRIDDIENRMDYLIANQMWTGNNLTSDSESLVYDIVFERGESEIAENEGKISVTTEGVITTFINRQK